MVLLSASILPRKECRTWKEATDWQQAAVMVSITLTASEVVMLLSHCLRLMQQADPDLVRPQSL